MVNKRGWLRIVEALVSILIVFGAVLTVVTTNKQVSENDFCVGLQPIVYETAQNTELREEILRGENTKTLKFVNSKIVNPALRTNVKICSENDLCPLDEGSEPGVDVCAEEHIISGNVNGQFVIKKLKVFLLKVH